MARNPLVDARDTRFILFEMVEADKKWKEIPKYGECDRETAEEFLELAEKISVEELYPTNMEGDKIGCKYNPDTKEVSIPECYASSIKAFYEAGFLGMNDDPELGGMGMPASLSLSCAEYFTAANMSLMMYPGLSHGAMGLIANYGSEEQIEAYYPKMLDGEWGGTMCITEPDAGSDVGQVKSKAVKHEDGSYRITGQNIFISSGENDYYKNNIHMKLARIEGDPPGTAGISLFIVPKFLINDDGSLGERNDVFCAGIEHKMGIKGSATSTLAFGDNGNCVGYLIGKQGQGMEIMFHMMNEERAMVGCQALGQASTAYMHAITYASNRIQGAKVMEMLNPDPKPVPTINHPDMKRMLLRMKSYVEAMRMTVISGGHIKDLEDEGTDEEKENSHLISEFLRPILKAGNSDASIDVCSEAIQSYGGYGFCSDYPVEQFLRDTRILAIYEGTNGIQAMDFTMRKLVLDQGQKNYKVTKKYFHEKIDNARGIVDDKFVNLVENALLKFDNTVEMMMGQMKEGKFLHLFMEATHLQQAMALVNFATMHLWALTVAIPKMKAIIGDTAGEDLEKLLEDNNEAAYYYGRVTSGQFFIANELPKVFGLFESLMIADESILNAHNACFTGALEE